MLHGCDLPLNLPYTLADLADDAMRVLDHFKIKKAHIVGFSMGGMVAQHMAFTWPTRILSLLIISSSSGDPNLPKSAAKVWRPFFRWPNNTSIEAIFEHAMHLNSLLNSDIEKMPSTELVQLIYMNLQRSMPNNGDIARQQLAILADVTRHEKLSSIICPTLIIQGDQDPLFTSEHGFDLAMRIPKAVFINIPAMGHNLASDEENALYVIFIAHLNKAHNSMI
jgi:pimeloyl-ACP methyl ester carboxylesterase